MNCFKTITAKRTRISLLLILCLLFLSPMTAAQTTSFDLGKLTKGSMSLVYDNVQLDTYNAYGTNYIAVSDLTLLGFNISNTTSPKAIFITRPAIDFKTTTASSLQITPSNFSLYDGAVYLGTFKTQSIVSNGRVFIPVGALSDMGTLNISDNICYFTPTMAPPVKANENAIVNLTNCCVSVSIIDLYWTDHAITYNSTYTLKPNEILKRTPHIEGKPLYLATLVQGVSGNGILYTNNSQRGQVNQGLLKKYTALQKQKAEAARHKSSHAMNVADAENFVNTKGLSSPTKYLVWTNIASQRTYIFTGSKNNWTLVKSFLCSTGRDRTPTPKGTFHLTYKVPSFGQSKGYCCKYAFGFIGTTYLYHSIIYDKTGSYLLENTGILGRKASQGCIRFSTENAKWFYDTLISGTTVYIN